MPEPVQDVSSIANDLGLNDGPAVRVLIDALSGTGQVDMLAVLRSQFDAQIGDNPQAALLLRLLELREQQANEPQEETAPVSEEEEQSEHDKLTEETRRERARNMRKLEETVNKVYAELEAMRVRNDAVAAALGACHLCFGDDPLCEECEGLGLPGSLAPEPVAFRKYVLPAFRHAKAVETTRVGFAPRREHVPARPANPTNPTPGG